MKIDFEGAKLYVRPGATDLRKDFWLAQKRLEMATWLWLNTSHEARETNTEQFEMLLARIDFWHAHEEKISEAEFLERRVNDVKHHMDNLHSWLIENKQKKMILDSSKTKAVMEQEHHVLFCPLLKCQSEYFNRLSQMSF